MKNSRCLIFVFLFSVCSYTFAEQPLVVGILEEIQCKQEAQRAVRPLFAKQGNDWIALDEKAKAASYKMERFIWTSAFDGRTLGEVISYDPKIDISPEWTYSRDYLHVLSPGQSLPQVKNKARRFSGWCGDVPQHLPIVMVSKPYFTDPEHWKRSKSVSSDRQILFSAFEKSFKKLCMIKSKSTTLYQLAPYQPSDLKVMDVYKSAHGEKLVSLSIGEGYYECEKEDEPDQGDDAQRWFFVSKNTHYLGFGLTLVDAGDYDNDGKSEALFWYDAYNRNGYVLFYDEFRKRVDFIWSYH